MDKQNVDELYDLIINFAGKLRDCAEKLKSKRETSPGILPLIEDNTTCPRLEKPKRGRPKKVVAQEKRKRAVKRAPKNYKHDRQWVSRSITAEAYKTVFGEDGIPNGTTNRIEVRPRMVEMQTKAGTWLGTYGGRGVSDSPGRQKQWDTLRLQLSDCNPEMYRTLATRAFWKGCEQHTGLNTTILKCWYFVRVTNAKKVVREFMKRTDLNKFGLKLMERARTKRFVVVDEINFRSSLYHEYGIVHLPGDRGWWKSELGAKKSEKAEVAQ